MATRSATPQRTQLMDFELPSDAAAVMAAAPAVFVARCTQELEELAVRDAVGGWHEVAYDVPGKGRVVETRVCRVRNGIAANYVEPYMRRSDPECMVIGDTRPTDKPTYLERFGEDFTSVRTESLNWLKTQRLVVFPFHVGVIGKGVDALFIAPENAGFFAFGLAMLQGIIPLEDLPANFSPKAVLYLVPPFRHTHFGGKQLVVHNRLDSVHELFSYNLYPGPSAKKGIYSILLNLGEAERWITMHCSTVQVITPYGNKVVIVHEGASGGGKSEMLEHAHRQTDGTLLVGRNLVTGYERTLTLPSTCDLRPITDDMALCHPSFEKGNGKLTLMDAEQAWFVRINHITQYGIDPDRERLTIHPSEPLLFLNIKASPDSTALIWEHIEDAPGVPCINPRVLIPRSIVPGIMHGPVDVDVRSIGVRTPPCTAEAPTYGIIGLFHILPPALAWLWRLVSPRGCANPDKLEAGGIGSEGVGSYWSGSTGRRVDHANLLLNQIIETPEVRYVLIPNQHIGAWHVGFMSQWITREYLARRGGGTFSRKQVKPSRCPLLGYAPSKIMMEGRTLGPWLFEVDQQPEVGPAAYDRGAEILSEFFRQELQQFLVRDLLPVGRKIIECCLAGGSLSDYENLLDVRTLNNEDSE
ncbi:MAG: DUF4914 family protein [Verrucomicrobiota bacterium]|nr:DUF4914 family protein [Verrucomicrobiota bacterium]